MVSLNPLIFREYDVRGVVGTDLTEDGVEVLGRAFGTWLVAHDCRKAVLGGDCRLSSAGFIAAIGRGLLSCGVDVVDVGVVPTPLLYFSMFHLDTEAGVMVTGSHNPKDFNGFKLCHGKTALFGEAIQEVGRIAASGRFASGEGRSTKANVIPAYMDRVAGDARLGSRKLKIVVDAGNGTGGVVAVPMFRRLGFDVVPLFCDMDGNFPNHHPDPTVPANLVALQKEVLASKADIGIAYDGDADRIGVVTEKGEILFGDMILLILALALLREVPGASFVSEVKCSRVLFDEIQKAGGKAVMWKVGHSLIKAKMAADGSLLGGEMSGHIFFKHRWYGFDDAIYTSLRFLEVLTAHKGPASTLLDGVPKTITTPEIRVECPDDVKFPVVDDVTQAFKSQGVSVVDVDGARVTFPHGWGLVRASNTQPVLVFRFEADSKAALDEIQTTVMAEVDKAKARHIHG